MLLLFWSTCGSNPSAGTATDMDVEPAAAEATTISEEVEADTPIPVLTPGLG